MASNCSSSSRALATSMDPYRTHSTLSKTQRHSTPSCARQTCSSAASPARRRPSTSSTLRSWVSSQPSSPLTTALLKPESLFINIGRGTLIKSEELLTALKGGNLFGAAIDVTDPEPLPDNHALWSHPRCIITPHTSGNCTGEYEIAADVAVANAERIRAGQRPFNVVDLRKGY